MTIVEVTLEPTPEKRAAYRSRTTQQRTWGWVTVGAGAVVMAGSGGFLLWNRAEERDAEAAVDDEFARFQSGGDCEPGTPTSSDCGEALDIAIDELDSVRAREKIGWIGLGIGAVAAGFGGYLLLSNDDPARYEPRPESDVFGRVRVVPSGWASPLGAGFAVIGAF